LWGRLSPARADVDRSYRFGIVASVDNPCIPGEVDFLTGVEITTTKTSVNSNGSLHITVHTVCSGAITDSRGVVYNVKGQDHFDSFDSLGAPVITTHIEDLNAITPGPDFNFVIHNSVHTTVNGNGEVTAQSFNFFSECKSSH
jgi:hypothetical protein